MKSAALKSPLSLRIKVKSCFMCLPKNLFILFLPNAQWNLQCVRKIAVQCMQQTAAIKTYAWGNLETLKNLQVHVDSLDPKEFNLLPNLRRTSKHCEILKASCIWAVSATKRYKRDKKGCDFNDELDTLWAPNSLAAMKGRTANWLLEKNTYETYGICIAYACTSRIVETCMQFDLNMYAIWFKKHVYKYIPKHVFTPGSTFPNAISDIGLVQCPCWRPTTPLHRGKWTWYLNGSVPLNSPFTGGVWYNQWLANTHKVNWIIDGHCESMMSIFNHQCMEQSLKKMPVYWPIAFICDWLILDCNRRKPPNTKYEDIWGI